MAKTDAELRTEALKDDGFIDKLLKWYKEQYHSRYEGAFGISKDRFYDATLGMVQTGDEKFKGEEVYQTGEGYPDKITISTQGGNMQITGGPTDLNAKIGGHQISTYLISFGHKQFAGGGSHGSSEGSKVVDVGNPFKDATFIRYMLRCYSNIKITRDGRKVVVNSTVPDLFKQGTGNIADAWQKWQNNANFVRLVRMIGYGETLTKKYITFPTVYQKGNEFTKGVDDFLVDRIAPALLGGILYDKAVENVRYHESRAAKLVPYLPKLFMDHLGSDPKFEDANERRLFLLMGGRHYGKNDIPYLNIMEANNENQYNNVPQDVRKYWKKHYDLAVRKESAGPTAGLEGLKQILGEDPSLTLFAKYITHGAPSGKDWSTKVYNYKTYNPAVGDKEYLTAAPFVTNVTTAGAGFLCLNFPSIGFTYEEDRLGNLSDNNGDGINDGTEEKDLPANELIPTLLARQQVKTLHRNTRTREYQNQNKRDKDLTYAHYFPSVDSINKAALNKVSTLGRRDGYIRLTSDRIQQVRDRGLAFSPTIQKVKEMQKGLYKDWGITNFEEKTVYIGNPNAAVLDDVYKTKQIGYNNEDTGIGFDGVRDFAESNETILDFDPQVINKQLQNNLLSGLTEALAPEVWTAEQSVPIGKDLVDELYKPLKMAVEMVKGEYKRFEARVAKFKYLVSTGEDSSTASDGLILGSADAVPGSAHGDPNVLREYYILQLWIDAVNAAAYKSYLFLRRSQFNVEQWIRFSAVVILFNKNKSNAEIDNLLKSLAADSGAPNRIAGDILKDVSPPAPPAPDGDDEEEDLGEIKERLKERRKNADQCLISTNIETLKHAYHKIITRELQNKKDGVFSIHRDFANEVPYAFGNRFNCLRHSEGDHGEIPNMLTAHPASDLRLFLNTTPDIQSALTPKIRLYRVTDSSQGRFEYETEFTFKNFVDPKEMKRLITGADAIQKGQGGGIKSFTWTYEGGTPATAKKDINAELTLYFQSFAELTKRRGTQERSWRYIDLLLYPTSDPYVNENKNSHPTQYNPTNFRIRADVGWHVRTDNAFRDLLLASSYADNVTLTESEQEEIKQIIKKAKAKKNENGYNDAFKSVVGRNLLKRFNKGLRKINKSLLLNMIDHDIDFKNDGSVELKITYAAYAESMARSSLINALSTPEIEYYRESADRELYRLLNESNCRKEEINAIRSEQASAEKNLIVAAQGSIVRRLLDRKLQRTVVFNKEQADNYLDKDFFGSTPVPIFNDTLTLPSNYDMDKQRAVKFYFMGDIIHTILDCLYLPDTNLNATAYSKQFGEKLRAGKYKGQLSYTKRRPATKNFIPLLSSIIYSDYNTKKDVTGLPQTTANKIFSANIADIPISVDYFNKWMRENVIKPERTVYPLMSFIRDLLEAVIELLTDVCINRNVDASLMFQTQQIRAKSLPQYDSNNKLTGIYDSFISLRKQIGVRGKTYSINEIFVDVDKHYNKKITQSFEVGLPLLTSDEDDDGKHISSDQYKDYMLIYAVSPILATSHQGRGVRAKDEKRGTYHFLIGNNKGLLKNIKFSKTDMAYLREARYYNQGNYGLLQLGAVYNVDLELFGNTIFYPGMEIFIDPRSFGGPQWDPTKGGKGRSIANALGIGGYHTITRVTCTISPSGFKTSLQAVFQYAGDISSRNNAIDGQNFEQDKAEDITSKAKTRSIKCVEAVDSAIEQSIRAEAARKNSSSTKFRF